MKKMAYKSKAWFFNNKFYSFLLIFLVLSFSTYIFYRHDVLDKYTSEVKSINEQIDKAQKKNDELEAQTEYKNSLEYIEKLARDKLGMVKNNEIIFYDSK